MTVRVGAALVALAVVVLVVGSSGASSITLERSIDVQVVDDSEAMLAVDGDHPTVTNQTADEVPLVTVTNQAGTAFQVSAEIDSESDLEAELRPVESTIEPGERTVVTATVSCEDDRNVSAAVPVTVSAQSDSTVIETTVETTVSCAT